MSPQKIDVSSGFKDCTVCLTNKSLDEFFMTQTRGYSRYESACKVCRMYRDTLRRWKSWGVDNAEEVWQLKQSHNGQCDICGSVESLHMDHCHDTGKFRGFLCSNCNHGLGKFKDDPKLLDKAKEYLL